MGWDRMGQVTTLKVPAQRSRNKKTGKGILKTGACKAEEELCWKKKDGRRTFMPQTNLSLKSWNSERSVVYTWLTESFDCFFLSHRSKIAITSWQSEKLQRDNNLKRTLTDSNCRLPRSFSEQSNTVRFKHRCFAKANEVPSCIQDCRWRPQSCQVRNNVFQSCVLPEVH